MVPTAGVLKMLDGRGFRNLRPWTHGVDTELFQFHERALKHTLLGTLARPVALFVGRVSYEKNIEAFLSRLVMAEAMACGTPVAAYPVDGPLEVLGRAGPDGEGSLGGALHTDLREAYHHALAVPRAEARLRALDFSWARAGELFVSHLVSVRQAPAPAGRVERLRTVTKPSSNG